MHSFNKYFALSSGNTAVNKNKIVVKKQYSGGWGHKNK